LNGNKIPQYQTQGEFDEAAIGWFNAGNDLVLAKSGDMNVTSTKVFEFLYGEHIYLPITLNAN